MFNRSEILTTAWASYREYAVLSRFKRFDRFSFGMILRMTWAAAREAAKPVLPAKANPAQVRIDAINGELRAMDLSDSPTNWSRQSALQAELARLAMIAA